MMIVYCMCCIDICDICIFDICMYVSYDDQRRATTMMHIYIYIVISYAMIAYACALRRNECAMMMRIAIRLASIL